jgi:DNA-binding NtrC family response regulator
MTSGVPAVSARSTSVLLVEDEALIRVLLAEELTDAGFLVVEAANVDQALEQLQATHVDLVVTDVRMPGDKDGLDLAAWVHAHCPAVPVMVMSGYVHEAVVAGSATCIGFIRKPFMPAELVDRVRAVMRLL